MTRPNRNRHILVALDDTESSRRAAVFVDRFFAGIDTRVDVLSVAESPLVDAPAAGPGGMLGGATGSAEVLRQISDATRAAAERIASDANLDADVALVAEGDPVDAITRVAAERDVDLVVVGSSHKGLWQRLISGSVSRGVVDESPAPVLVVR